MRSLEFLQQLCQVKLCASRRGREARTRRVWWPPTPPSGGSPSQDLPPGPGDPFHLLLPCAAREQPVLGANKAAPSSGRET